jgi:hypothetical protein
MIPKAGWIVMTAPPAAMQRLQLAIVFLATVFLVGHRCRQWSHWQPTAAKIRRANLWAMENAGHDIQQ